MASSNASASKTSIYLDHAATSFPKPPSVMAAMVRFANEIGANAGRGSYQRSMDASEIVATCRKRLAMLLNAPSPQSIVFTAGCTDALNLAINGLCDPSRPGHVVCTSLDHNSVLRPLHALRDRGWISLSVVPAEPGTGCIDPDDVTAAMRADTRLVVFPHASNVTGGILPVESITAVARARGAAVLLDAAQTAGHLPIDLQRLGVDLCAFPGHKGLLGPLGTGALYIRPGFETQLQPTRLGGTGSESSSLAAPTTMPDRFEAGSPNVIGLAGLSAGVEYSLERGVSAIAEHDRALIARFLEKTTSLRRLALYGKNMSNSPRVGVVSFNIEGFEPSELAIVLESHYGCLTRSGLHCAPLAHRDLGTLPAGGAVRASFGYSTTFEEVDALTQALAELAGG